MPEKTHLGLWASVRGCVPWPSVRERYTFTNRRSLAIANSLPCSWRTRKPRKALWEAAFNDYIMEIHPHDLHKTQNQVT